MFRSGCLSVLTICMDIYLIMYVRTSSFLYLYHPSLSDLVKIRFKVHVPFCLQGEFFSLHLTLKLSLSRDQLQHIRRSTVSGLYSRIISEKSDTQYSGPIIQIDLDGKAIPNLHGDLSLLNHKSFAFCVLSYLGLCYFL